MIQIPAALMDAHVKNCGGSRVGATVLLYRTLLGITAKELAERSGVSPSLVSRIERGEASGSAPLLAGIERGLQVDPGSILRLHFLDKDLKVSELPTAILDMVIDMLSEAAADYIMPIKSPADPVHQVVVQAPPAPTLVEVPPPEPSPEADDLPMESPKPPQVNPGANIRISTALDSADAETLDLWASVTAVQTTTILAEIQKALDSGHPVADSDVLGILRFYAR